MDISDTPFVEVRDEALHKEEFRNESLRIYRAVLEPGQRTEFHRHSANTLYFVCKGGRIVTEPMKGTSPGPTFLLKGTPLIRKLRLAFEKTFRSYLTLEKGLMFYMPGGKYPVIHRAEASIHNQEAMILLGVEIF